jgi:hypothetical protein
MGTFSGHAIASYSGVSKQLAHTVSVATATDCTWAFLRQLRFGVAPAVCSLMQKCSHEMDGPASLTLSLILLVKSHVQCWRPCAYQGSRGPRTELLMKM